MKTAGIICEYNPFHTGHAWQIAEIRRLLGVDTAIICAMSGNFVQRGDFALCRKHTRAEAAIMDGADLVLEIPVPWATASAEGFGRGGVTILDAAGIVDTLCFGSECADSEKIRRVAQALNGEQFSQELKAHLSEGTSFASARQSAAEAILGADAAIMREPNDILGISYAQEILRRDSRLSLLALPRRGASHDGETRDGFASASFLRERLLSGESVGEYLTFNMAALYEGERRAGRAPVSMNAAERAMLARLRSMTEDEMAQYDEGGEGLYHRLFAVSRTAATVEQLLSEVKTKRYAYAALRRMVLRMYLGVTPEETKKELPYLRVLACGERGREILKAMKKTATLSVLTKPADVRLLGKAAQQLFAIEARAADLYALAYPDLAQSAGGSEWTSNPVIL